MTREELKELIAQNIITNSNRVSTDKTTGTMLKLVLNEIVNSLGDKSVSHPKMYGEIKMYWGNYYELPSGWVICDGSNGTPDMRGRVPLGWSNGASSSPDGNDLKDYQHIGRTGGDVDVTLTNNEVPSHNHGGSISTSADGRHRHGFNDDQAGGEDGGGYLVAGSDYRNQSLQSAFTKYEEDHTHTVNIPSVGGGESHENRQPYIVMMYIMYTGESTNANSTVQWSEYDGVTGNRNIEGDSILKYGFRYVAPAVFQDPATSSSYNASQLNIITSNLGFIPEGDPARPLEAWLQEVSAGDNSGDDNII
jgi:microcystin-dependent protein